jgi:hypothetical protein
MKQARGAEMRYLAAGAGIVVFDDAAPAGPLVVSL